MPENARKVIFNVPNLMTLARIALIPVVVLLMYIQREQTTISGDKFYGYIVASLFILAAISDVIDGYYARKFKMVSIIGKFIDPVADKLMHMAVMIMLLPMGRFLPWLTVVILFREILITGMRVIAAAEGIIMEADTLGKNKTALFNVGFSGILLYYPVFGIELFHPGIIVVMIGTLFSYISGVDYMVKFFRRLK